MTSRRAKLHEDTNFRLMKILEANSDLSQREMGKALGISFGGVNYCLNALMAKGLVKVGNCTVYVPTLAGHCGDNSDLQATGWRDWYEGVRKTFAGVKQRHEQVFVGGLSMGAVMSMYVAAEHPGQVAGLLMYSTTLKYDGWSINKMAFITPLLIRIPFGVRLFRFTEKPPYGI